ncbi:hypothetical protein CYMTET_15996 [Cymbomonas tetramitiformis]|uniref:ABC transmembrane type-1 domain-containing protein n=1 Tax=Cymbomonas tetramitiformis TaxID=36881 RepID=A0AAE0GCW3_9CHLO|nr:hypothetical protein CYMTET_15996 [Cymbomonas tetramitiformis]
MSEQETLVESLLPSEKQDVVASGLEHLTIEIQSERERLIVDRLSSVSNVVLRREPKTPETSRAQVSSRYLSFTAKHNFQLSLLLSVLQLDGFFSPEDRLRLRQALKYTLTEKLRLLTATFFLCSTAALSLAVPWLLGKITDNLSGKRNQKTFNLDILLLAVIVFFRGVCNGVRRYLFIVSGESMVNKLKKDLFRSVLHREISFYDAENTGELISRMSDDTTKLRRTLSSNLPDGMRSLTVVTFGVFYLFIVSWKLSLAMFLVVPPIAIGLKYHGKKVRKMGKSVQQELGESAALASEALGNIRTVRSFSKEPGTLQIYAKCVDSAFQVICLVAASRMPKPVKCQLLSTAFRVEAPDQTVFSHS